MNDEGGFAKLTLAADPNFRQHGVMFPNLSVCAPLSLALFVCQPPAPARAEDPAPPVAVVHNTATKTVTVTVGGEVFTEVLYNTYAKPILWPVRGPGGVSMTRDWPMKPDTAGDDKDHPHHKSLWFTHGDVNGVDFWKEADDAGKIFTTAVPRAEVGPDGSAIVELRNEWRAPDGRVVCTDTTVIRCRVEGPARLIDFSITLSASQGEVVFGDTKEGTMAVRTRPEMNVDRKNPLAAGSARNHEGLTGTAVWGAKSRWVDYQAPISGKIVGLAMFDHPSNLRHPTTWHARDYGLVAANPFGLHDFSKDQPKGAGNHFIPSGKTQIFRYGIYLYEGALTPQAIDGAWSAWAAR